MKKKKKKIRLEDIEIPDFELTCDKKPTDDELAMVLVTVEDMDESMDETEEDDVETEEDAIEKEQSLKDRLHVDKYHDDGTKKSKEELADERYEKRKQVFLEERQKIADEIAKADQSLNVLFLKIEKISRFVSKVTDIQTYISALYDCLNKWKVELQANPYFRYAELKIKKFALKLKKKMLIFKQHIKEIEKEILISMYYGKCVEALEYMYAAIIASIIAIKFVIDKVMKALNEVISFLPDMIKVGPEAMSFFMTPKSLNSVPMPIVNLRKSVVDILDEGLRLAINDILTKGDNAKIASKGAYIAARIAFTQLNGVVTCPNLPNVPVPEPGAIIRKAIDLLINLIPFAKPLPKYENLNMFLNPGYLIFLMTGWARAGQCAFGMPGQLMGIKPSPAECAET